MTQKQAILKKLMGSRVVASWRLAEYCLQYNARIWELKYGKKGKNNGLDIKSCKLPDGKTDGFELLTDHSEIDTKTCRLKPKQGELL